MKTTTQELIERLRDFTETRSDYAVSKLIGVTRSNMTHYKNGGQFDNTVALKVSEILNTSYISIIAKIECEKNHKPEDAKLWSKYLKRLTVAAGLAAVTVMMILTAGSDLTYQENNAQTSNFISSIFPNIHYANLWFCAWFCIVLAYFSFKTGTLRKSFSS